MQVIFALWSVLSTYLFWSYIQWDWVNLTTVSPEARFFFAVSVVASFGFTSLLNDLRKL